MASRAAAQAKENVQNGFGALKRGTILLRSPEGRAKMLKKVVDGFAHVTSPLQARTRASTAADVREKETKRRRIHYGLTGKTGVKLRDLTLTDSDVNDLVKSLKRSGSRTWWSRTAMYEYVCLQILVLIQSDRSACKSRSIASTITDYCHANGLSEINTRAVFKELLTMGFITAPDRAAPYRRQKVVPPEYLVEIAYFAAKSRRESRIINSALVLDHLNSGSSLSGYDLPPIDLSLAAITRALSLEAGYRFTKYRRVGGSKALCGEKLLVRRRQFIVEYAHHRRLEEAEEIIICFKDESYVHQRHANENTWLPVVIDDEGKEILDDGYEVPTRDGERLILIHVITKYGVLSIPVTDDDGEVVDRYPPSARWDGEAKKKFAETSETGEDKESYGAPFDLFWGTITREEFVQEARKLPNMEMKRHITSLGWKHPRDPANSKRKAPASSTLWPDALIAAVDARVRYFEEQRRLARIVRDDNEWTKYVSTLERNHVLSQATSLHRDQFQPPSRSAILLETKIIHMAEKMPSRDAQAAFHRHSSPLPSKTAETIFPSTINSSDYHTNMDGYVNAKYATRLAHVWPAFCVLLEKRRKAGTYGEPGSIRPFIDENGEPLRSPVLMLDNGESPPPPPPQSGNAPAVVLALTTLCSFPVAIPSTVQSWFAI